MFIATNTVIFEPARYLVAKYKKLGLRTLDAIQLSTAISLIGYVDLFQTGDKLLQTFLEAEGLPTQIKL